MHDFAAICFLYATRCFLTAGSVQEAAGSKLLLFYTARYYSNSADNYTAIMVCRVRGSMHNFAASCFLYADSCVHLVAVCMKPVEA
jgi:hypothetical protein